MEPKQAVTCHCAACQQLSESPFRAVAFTKPNSFPLLSGEMKVYVKTAESGRKREQSFCGTCGSPIYSAPAEAEKPVVGLRVGTIKERALVLPRRQIWTSAALPWAQ